MKKHTTVSLEEELVEKAKKLGINISSSCERMLKKEIKRIEEEG